MRISTLKNVLGVPAIATALLFSASLTPALAEDYVIDEKGASLTSKGPATIETETFTAESRAGRVLVKAATSITVHDGSGQGNRFVLDARTKTITVRAATGATLKVGLDAAGLEMNESKLELAATPSKWSVVLGPLGTMSTIEGPTVKFHATDEIWLHAPSIPIGEEG